MAWVLACLQEGGGDVQCLESSPHLAPHDTAHESGTRLCPQAHAHGARRGATRRGETGQVKPTTAEARRGVGEARTSKPRADAHSTVAAPSSIARRNRCAESGLTPNWRPREAAGCGCGVATGLLGRESGTSDASEDEEDEVEESPSRPSVDSTVSNDDLRRFQLSTVLGFTCNGGGVISPSASSIAKVVGVNGTSVKSL